MIKIYIENVTDTKVSDYTLRNIRKVIRAAALQEKPDLKLECNVTLCDNEYIHQINKEYRGVDAPTDVLSFPFFDFDTPYTVAELGDIIISLDKTAEQAKEYGHSFKREICFLALHGTLHLFGYDHIKDDDRMIMEQKQRDILDRLEIHR